MRNKVSPMTPTAYASITLVAIAALLIYVGTDLPFSAAMFPLTILGALVILGIVLFINEIYNTPSTRNGDAAKSSNGVTKIFLSLACMVIYIALVNILGFFTTTFLMVPVVSYVFGYKDVKKSIPSAALYTAMLYIIFNLAMGRELPHGILM